MNLSKSAVKKPITILMIVIAVLIIGGVALNRLSVDLYPDIELPIVATIVSYEGVGPEEIEQLITRPIEESVSGLPGIKQVSSTSSRGSSMIIAEFNYGTDMDYSEIKVREKVDTVKAFLPDGATSPMVIRFNLDMMPVMVMGVTGDRESYEIKEIVEEKILPYFERIDGVASVDVSGGDTREIQVLVDAYKLESMGLSISDIQGVIASENSNYSSGIVTQGQKDYLLRIKNEFTSLEDLGNVLVPLKTGGTIQLKYIADIEDAFAKKTMYSFLNGKNGIGLNIYKQSDANTVSVSEQVNLEIEKLQETLPPGIELFMAYDSAEFINLSISNVVKNGLFGAFFAVVILYLFLRNIRSTLIIGTAIPISIVATFILMFFSGTTINILSLGGLALGVGLMVDSSIVVLENIYRFRVEKRLPRERAAILGAKEVSSAVIASTVTTICVFLPLVFVQGLSSQLFRPMSLTVTFSLFASLMVALTFVPMLASKLLVINKTDLGEEILEIESECCKEDSKATFITKFFRKVSDKFQQTMGLVKDKYIVVLDKALHNRRKVIFGTIAAILASVVVFTLFVGKEFIPSADSGYFTVDLNLARNTVIDETLVATEKIEQVLSEIDEIDQTFVTVGGGGMMMGGGSSDSRSSNLMVKLKPIDERKRSIDQVMDDVRAGTADMAGAEISVAASGGAISSGAPIAIEIKGSDLSTLEEISEEIAGKVKAIPNTREVSTSFDKGSPEIEVIIDRDKASAYGLSSYQVAGALRQSISGVTATKYREGGNEYDVKIMLYEEQRAELEAAKRIMIPTPMGFSVPLEEVSEIIFAEGPSSIARKDQTRVATISGDISGRDLASISSDIKKSLDDMVLPSGYTIEFGGSNQEMVEAFTSLGLALLLALILVYMVMASQFEALLHPFVIMFSIPPTFIGITIGLFLTGRNFGVTAFIGVIMLAGIVVNNAIVLVDYVNTLRKSGMETMDALKEAGSTRFRPILMTTLTTILALMPQTIGIGEGAELMAPMATVVVFGLFFSSVITLVLVPVVYYSMNKFAEKYKARVSQIITGGQK